MHDDLLIHGRLTTVSPLYIGATADRDGAARDLQVVRDPSNDMPLIPGSSLRGRMRRLLEASGDPQDLAGFRGGLVAALPILFGAPGRRSALAFWDCPPEEPWVYEHRAAGLPLTHWCSEMAPVGAGEGARFRRRELVSTGVRFRLRLTLSVRLAQGSGLPADTALRIVRQGLGLLEQHGVGGATARGFGRLVLSDLATSPVGTRREQR